MAVRKRYRLLIECDTEAERDLSWPIDSLIYTVDTAKYYKQESGDWTEVPADEIFLTSLIPISKLAFSGIPSEEKYLRSDGAWAEPAIPGGIRILYDSWNFDTNTSATDPGSNNVKFDNGTLGSVTNLYISDLSLNNNDFSVVLSNLDSGDTIYIQEKDNAANAVRFQISATPTDNTGWWTIPVTVVNSVGSVYSNNQDVAIVFSFGGGGGTGGGHTIQDEGTPLTQRTNLNFERFTVTDDAGNDATVVTRPPDTFVGTTAPSNPVAGDIWTDTTDTVWKTYVRYDGYWVEKNAVTREKAVQTNVWFNLVTTIDQDIFLYAATIIQITKTAGVATAEYKVNSGAWNTITFSGNNWIGAIVIAANDQLSWRITYTGGYTSATLSYLINRN